MDITVDTAAHQYSGSMKVVPETTARNRLTKRFHLFFNAFQPGSMMDVRSRTISDPTAKIREFLNCLKMNTLKWLRSVSTGSRWPLSTMAPCSMPSTAPSTRKKATFEMEWTAQVPRQIRRSGWMNKEGVEYSMTQWYPKLCEYDHDGWHTERTSAGNTTASGGL